MSARSRLARQVLIGTLLAVYALAAASSIRQKSITFDELAHLTGGFSSWTTRDYRLFPQNGQFAQRWAALPLVVFGFRFPTLDGPAWWSSDVEAVGHRFLYAIGNDHEALVWRARLMMIPLGMLLGWLCYAWSARLFGVSAGLVALVVFVFSPAMLAHGPLATSDLSAALLFTGALASLWRVLHRADPLRTAGSAVVMGLLFVTKMSALLMVPVAAILVAIRIWEARPFVWSGRPRRVLSGRRRLLRASMAILLVHVVGVIVVIWASYGFRYATFRIAVPGRDHMFIGETIDTLAEHDYVRIPIRLARDLRLLPEPYLFGLAHVLNRSGRFIGFLNGQYSRNGWWFFFPYCWLVKTPLAVFGLLGLAAAWRYTGRRRLSRTAYRLTPLFVFLAVYAAATVSSSLNLGERHLLPAYPAAFILAGGAGCWLGRKHLVAASVAALLLLSLPIEALRIWPHYLAYFNRLAGGPSSGYRHLVDSSLDWGQDLPALKQWLDRERLQQGGGNVYLSYFGTARPEYYGIQATSLAGFIDRRPPAPPVPLGGGVYCVSATMLDVVSRLFYKPEYETNYQAAVKNATVFAQASRDEQAMSSLMRNTGEEYWRQLFGDLDQLRTGRLLAFLRQRRPDAMVGYSILIYRLTDADVARALNDPLSASR